MALLHKDQYVMNSLNKLLRLIGGVLTLPFLVLILLIVKPIRFLMRRRKPANKGDSKPLIKKLLVALEALGKASTPQEVEVVLQRHPELLCDQADTLLAGFIDKLKRQGKADLAQFVQQNRELLQTIRQTVAGENHIPAAFKADIKRANAGDASYQQGAGVQALNEAVAAWERILNHPDFATADEEFRLVVLNDSANTYLRRYKVTGVLKDLNRALSSWETVLAKTPDNSPDLPSRLSNLGIGLRARYAHTGDAKDLERGMKALQKAVKYDTAALMSLG
jgi:tetratricopeptide (TPR) repeat protein